VISKKRKILKIIRDGVILIIILVAIRAYMQRDAIDGLAPDLKGSLLSGQEITLAQLQGKPALVHFWATWCGICRFEQDSINDIAKDHQVLSIAMSSGEPSELLAYMRENGLAFPVLPDPNGELSKTYGVRGVPASFIIDQQGQIRFTEVGYTSEWGLRFRLWLATFY